MIILTNAQGDVLNTIPDKVYQGSNLANQIVIVSPWSANLQVTIAYKLPNGDFTEPKLMTAFATNPLPENLQANAWSIDIDEPVTENFGLVEFQFKASNGTQIIATGGCSFTVQHGVAPILPATPSQTIYEQILEAISVLSSTIVAGDFESKALTPYDSTFEYSKYDVIADFQTYGGMYYSLTDNNKGNLPTDTTKWAILPYATLTQLSASIQAHNTSQTAHTDIRTEIANIVNGNTTIEKYQTKDNLVDTWATTPTDSTYPSAKLVKTTIDKIKSDKGLINFVFATKQDFLGWIDGTIETDINGRTTRDLQIGSNILIQEENVTDYWCSSISDPLTINDFTPLETEINLSNYLAKDNTTEYTPTGDYNPATKKYVDDSNNIASLDLSHGEETVTYDTTDGMTVRTTSQLKYNTNKTTTFDTEFNLPLVPADDSITITADGQNKKFTIKSNGGGKDNLLVVYNDDKTRIYCKRILSVPDIQPNTKFDIIFGTTPIQGTLDITVVGKLSAREYVGSITRHIGVDYQGETAPKGVYKDSNYTQVDKSIAQYIFIGSNSEPLTVDARGLFVTIQNSVRVNESEQSLQNVQVIIEYTGLKTENLDTNWLLNITAGESSAGTISKYASRPSGYVNSVQSARRIYGIGGGGEQTTYRLNGAGLEYGSDIPCYYNGQIGVSVIPSPLNELQDDLYTTSSIYATVNGGYLQKCVTLKGTTNPTTSTQAYYVGQLYLNTTDKTLFKCDSINGSTYTWTAVCGNGGTFDSTPTKNSTNPVTSNGIQQALVDNVGVSLQACTTYQQIVDLLNANHNIGYGNIGSSAETTGLRALLPRIPFDSNFGSVRARIISQGGAMGNNTGLWALEFVLTSDFDAGGETQKPVWHLYVRNSIVSDTDTLYVGEWG